MITVVSLVIYFLRKIIINKLKNIGVITFSKKSNYFTDKYNPCLSRNPVVGDAWLAADTRQFLQIAFPQKTLEQGS